MSKYIDAEKLIAEIDRRIGIKENLSKRPEMSDMKESLQDIIRAYQSLKSFITSLQQEQDMGEVSDGYHTFNELYYYRMLYNAAFFNLLPKDMVHKSKRHHTGEECFGGGWFIVMANLPTGQVSNHYELKDWDLFRVPEKEFADEWDGHTPQEAAKRLYEYLQQEQPHKSFCEENCKGYRDTGGKCFFGFNCSAKKAQEQPEVDLEKEELVGVAESPLKTFPRVNDFECGSSYRH